MQKDADPEAGRHPDPEWPKNRNMLMHRQLHPEAQIVCLLSSAFPSPILNAGLRWKIWRDIAMDWKTLLAYVTGSVDAHLILRHE